MCVCVCVISLRRALEVVEDIKFFSLYTITRLRVVVGAGCSSVESSAAANVGGLDSTLINCTAHATPKVLLSLLLLNGSEISVTEI